MLVNECINFSLTRTQSSVFNYFKKSLEKLDLIPIQYAILKCLMENGDMSPSSLANHLYLNNSTITGQLTRLEHRGLLVREFNTDDRRVVIVHITEEGRLLEPIFDEIIGKANMEILSALTEEEANSLRQILDKVFEKSQELA